MKGKRILSSSKSSPSTSHPISSNSSQRHRGRLRKAIEVGRIDHGEDQERQCAIFCESANSSSPSSTQGQHSQIWQRRIHQTSFRTRSSPAIVSDGLQDASIVTFGKMSKEWMGEAHSRSKERDHTWELDSECHTQEETSKEWRLRDSLHETTSSSFSDRCREAKCNGSQVSTFSLSPLLHVKDDV